MQATTVLNTDSFTPNSQQALVLSLFESLKEGGEFLVHSSSSLAELCRKLDKLEQSNLHWQFTEESPSLWMIRVTKKEDAASSDGCCGACGG